MKTNTPRTYTKAFFYPKQGIGQIFDYIAEEIKKAGVSIMLNTRFKRLLLDGSNIRGVVCDTNGKDQVINCEHVISTIPITDLLLAPEMGEELNDLSVAVEFLKYRSLRFLNILVDKPEIGRNTWTYIPDEQYIMTRIQEPKKRSPHNVPGWQNILNSGNSMFL